jgi:hypothetical protein
VKPVFQTRANFVDGNCFAAAVASILELDEIPEIDPRPLGCPEAEIAKWQQEWTDWFTARGFRWYAYSWDTPEENLRYASSTYLPEYVIANIGVNGNAHYGGAGHAVVFRRGVPVHDPIPGSPFLKLPEWNQRLFPILAFTCIVPIEAA